MRSFLLLPVFALLLVAIQTTVFGLLSQGKINVEISIIVVIFAAFYLRPLQGMFLSFLLGFFLDCIISLIPSLFVFIYLLVFFLSSVVSYKVYSGNTVFIAGFSFFCTLLAGIIVGIACLLLNKTNIFPDIVHVLLLQSLIVGAISPLLFAFLHRLKVFIDVEES